MSNPKFNIFLSYGSEDLIIARALREQLMLFDTDNVNVFHDAANIRTGIDWRRLLGTKLRESHWLIAVHTGGERATHSYPGWEVGIFEESHKGDDRAKVVCLYDTETFPQLFAEKQNRKVDVPSSRPDEQGDYYSRTDLGKFLDDFVEAYEHLVPSESRKDALEIQQRKKPAAACITKGFWTCQQNDIQGQTFPQHRITIRVEGEFFQRNSVMHIPDTASVITSEDTNAVIGVESIYDARGCLRQYTWGELRQQLANQHGGNADWMDHIDEVIDGYVTKRNKGLDRVSFRTRENRIFRAALSRVIQYKSGAQEFEMELIQSFPRAFKGDDRTSRLLIGLIFASRFRFTFLEGSADSYTDSYDTKLRTESGPMFLATARQLVRDIERMEQESAEFGLTRPELLIRDLGPSNEEIVKLFFNEWQNAKSKLWAAMAALANGSATEDDVRKAFGSFRDRLMEVNERYITLSLDVYKHALGLRHDCATDVTR